MPTTDILLFSQTGSNTQHIDFSKATKLKWVHATWAGTDDIAYLLKDTPILLTNSSGVHPIPIAEHVFTFMLIFARNITTAYREQIVNKKWDRGIIATQPLYELHQQTIGIVGYGRIGKRLAHVAKDFDMKVSILSHTSSIHDKNVDATYTENNLEELLQTSHFVIKGGHQNMLIG